MKILIVIANYGVNQINYAKQLVKEYKSWPEEVDVIINTNVALNIEGAVDNVMLLEDTMLYPKSTLRTIYENKGKYDLYIFCEADVLITYKNIKYWLQATNDLPLDIYAGFMRYEIDEASNKPYPANRSYNDMHHQRNPWVWDYDSVFVHKGIAYAQFTNTHQACLVFNDAQLDFIHSKMDISDINHINPNVNFPHNALERVDMDIFPFFRKKVLPISRFDDCLVHHVQNRYVNIPPSDPNYWMKGVDEETMQHHITLLNFYAQHWQVTENFMLANPGYSLEGVNHNKGIK